MSNSNLVVEIRKLHKSYKDLLKFNVAKRELPRFKKKEELFLDQLPVLFNITVKSLIPSNLITAEDRSFLLHNWDKTISSTLDVTPKQAVEKKLVRQSAMRNPASSPLLTPPTPPPVPSPALLRPPALLLLRLNLPAPLLPLHLSLSVVASLGRHWRSLLTSFPLWHLCQTACP